MNKLTSLLAVALLFASASAWSATDLTYCLALKSNIEIAKCAGETSTRNKGKPMSKEEVQKLLARETEKAPEPSSLGSAAPATPAAGGDTTAKPEAGTDAASPDAAPKN